MIGSTRDRREHVEKELADPDRRIAEVNRDSHAS
jgi:hypothetical protein